MARQGTRQVALVLILSTLLVPLAAHFTLTPTTAQQSNNPPWTSYSSNLTSGDVRAVHVDQDHSVWFGTARGVDHFDGTWHAYTAEDGLPDGPIEAIAQTGDGILWFGGRQGLARLAREGGAFAWTPLDDPLLAGPVHVLWADDERVWAATDDGVAYSTADGWQSVGAPPDSGAFGRVLAITGDGQGGVWFGGDGDALTHFDPSTNTVQALERHDSMAGPIQALLVTPATAPGDAGATLWVGTRSSGLWSRNAQQWSHFWRPPGSDSTELISSNNVLALAQDDEGTLWIGTNGGGVNLFGGDGLNSFWGGGSWRTLTAQDGLAANAVADLALDSSGVAWIGTIAGVSQFDVQSWRTLSSPDVPAGLEVVTTLLDSQGGLWVGSDYFGLIYYDGHDLHRITQEGQGLPENFVRSLVEDDQGYLWVGTARLGLARAPLAAIASATGLDAAGWERFDASVLESNVLRASIRARDGSLWFGTFAGLAHYTPGSGGQDGTWETFGPEDGLISREISQNALLEDSQGHIWVGTAAGLSRFDPEQGEWQSFTAADGMADDLVLSLAEVPAADGSPDGAILVGTRVGGIRRYDRASKTWEQLSGSTTPVNALLVTGDRYLWIGTTSGLTKFDLDTWLQRLYRRSDGLIDNEIHTLDSNGQGDLWIGTGLGVVRHRPDPVPPWVEIVSVNGQVPQNGHVQVLAGEPIAISYRGADLSTPPDGIAYRVKLQGVDSDWKPVDERQTTYRGLEPGQYTFLVEARDRALNLSDPPASIRLDMVPTVVLPLLGRVPVTLAYLVAGLLGLAAVGSSGAGFMAARNRRRRRQAVKRHFNPYVSGEPVQKSDMFFGREEVLAKILNTLHENSIMIHGQRRIGKTSLLHQLAYQLRTSTDPDYLFVPVYVDLEGTPEEEFFHVMMEEIVHVVPGYLPAMPDLSFESVEVAEYDHREFSRDLGVILKALQATNSREIRLVLLLDEMDVMNGYSALTQQQLRRIFMRTYAQNLGAVVAGIEISKEWDRIESPWYNLFNEIELGPLAEPAARHLILDPVKGIYTFEPAAVDFIIQQSGGHPYFIQQHCLEAVSIMLADGRSRITLQDAQEALDFIANTRSSHDAGLTKPPLEDGL